MHNQDRLTNRHVVANGSKQQRQSQHEQESLILADSYSYLIVEHSTKKNKERKHGFDKNLPPQKNKHEKQKKGQHDDRFSCCIFTIPLFVVVIIIIINIII